MKTLIRSILLLACATLACAQFSISVYVDTTTDGNYFYGTGQIQYSPGENCTMCEDSTHTYSGGVTVYDPANNQSSCSYYGQYSAMSSEDIGCEATIPVNFQAGSFTGTHSPMATCSTIGQILKSLLPLPLLQFELNGFVLQSLVGAGGLYQVSGVGCPTKYCGYQSVSTKSLQTYYLQCISVASAFGNCLTPCLIAIGSNTIPGFCEN